MTVTTRSVQLGTLCLFIAWAFSAVAQVQIDGLHVSASGAIDAGYSAENSNNGGGSSNGVGLGGSGDFHGYYYNPNFLSFDVLPYYSRSNSNSESQSITDSSGYSANSNIFSGSRTPGTVGFNQAWNSSGTFGIPGVAGLTTKNNGSSFAASWAFLANHHLPSLNLAYGQSSGNSSLLGSDVSNSTSGRNFGASTGFHLAGFGLGFGYQHQQYASTSNISSAGAADLETVNTGYNDFDVNFAHALPRRGSLNGTFTRSYSNSSGLGESDSTVLDNLSVSGSEQVWRLPISANVLYNDDVYGSILQQLASNGQLLPTSVSTPTVRVLQTTVSTAYRFPGAIYVNGFLSRQEEMVGGQDFGLTQVGFNVHYNFGRRLKGLVITLGATDAASGVGNSGAGLVGNASYSRNFGHWETSSYVSYNQSVQTLLAMYTQSSFSYNAQLRRHLANGMNLVLGGGGGHSVFVQQAGSGSSSEGFNAGMSWLRQTLNANYQQSSGVSIVSTQGLVPVTTPGLLPNLQQNFSGRSYGAGWSSNLRRDLTMSLAWTKSLSNMTGQSLLSNSGSQMYNGYATYHFRKIYFNAGATRFMQSISNSGVGPSVLNSYYVGISRWFKAF